MTFCPVCESDSILPFLERKEVPVHQNLLLRSKALARRCARGDLLLAVCQNCGFIFNQAFDPSKVDYGGDYDNSQDCSPFFDDYVSRLVGYLIHDRGLQNCRIVEVGCGKGHFLRKLVEWPEANNEGWGCDPSYVGPLADLGGRLRFAKSHFEPKCAGTADAIVCRHVIEHVPAPRQLLADMRRVLALRPHARVFLETPCAEWIFRNRMWCDFFYEHCSYFSKASLKLAFELADMTVETIRERFGGQYLWLEARAGKPQGSARSDLGHLVESAKRTGESEARFIGALDRKLSELAPDRIALWGAGAKGTTLANLLDPQCQRIACLVDINPNKQGSFIAGSGHPIVSYHDLPGYDVSVAVCMNPNYYRENLKLLTASRLSLELINLADWISK